MTSPSTSPRLPDLVEPVVEVEVRTLSVPLQPIIITRHYRIETIEMVVVRARDADGAWGMSTLWCFGVPQTKVLTATLEYLVPFLTAGRRVPEQDRRRIPALLAELHREINFLGFKGVTVFAYAALDMALVDLACRRAQASLSSLLGRRHQAVPVYWSGLFGNQTLPEILAEVDEKLAEGFRAMKLRTGGRPLDDDVARVEAVLKRLPAGVTLMIDAVQSWSRQEALAAVERLAEFPLHWIEDPLVHHDYEGLRQLVERSALPIATGENEYLRHGFDTLLDAGPPYLLVDLERVGGVHEWLAVAERARQRGAIMTPHVYPDISLQLCSALDQTETWIEYIPWWTPLKEHSWDLVDGMVRVPDTVGLGLDLDPAMVERFSLGPWQRL